MDREQARRYLSIPTDFDNPGIHLCRDWSDVDAVVAWINAKSDILNGEHRRLEKSISQVTHGGTASNKRDHEGLFKKALLNGASRKSWNHIDWPIHGDCQNRFTQTFKAAPFLDPWGRKSKRTYAMYLDIHTRCRKCEKCLRHRAFLWRVRCLSEYQGAHRTWFGTLTLTAERQFHYRLRARQRAGREKIVFEQLPTDKQFKRTVAEISAELTKGLKRFRRATGHTHATFKYIIVAEAHKSGNPHFHFLFHERNANKPIRYADLKRTVWREGFSNFKLVKSTDNPAYLCKYLSKSLLARVRASQRYGCETTKNPLQIGVSRVKTTTPTTKSSIF